MHSGKHGEALENNIKALNVFKQSLLESSEVVVIYVNIALSYQIEKKYQDALINFQEGLKIAKRINDPRIDLISEKIKEIELELREKTPWSRSPEVATILNEIGSTLGKVNKNEEMTQLELDSSGPGFTLQNLAIGTLLACAAFTAYQLYRKTD